MERKEPLEPFMPDGRTPRCQARSKRTGEQCRRAAVKGYRVCAVHGAGTRKRVEEGLRRPPGRPPIHGLYSERQRATLRALYEEVLALGDIEDTDRELALLKAVLWYLLEGAKKAEEREARLEALFARLEVEGERGLLPQVERLLKEQASYLDRLSEHAMRVIQAVKARAETASKQAEARALAYLLRLVEELKAVLLERLEPEVYETILEDLRKRVLGRVLPVGR